MSPKKKTAPEKKPTNQRSKVKNPGLKKQYNLKSRQEFLDFDYIEKLNDSEKEWLNRFIEEEVNADFRHKGKKLNRTKKEKQKIYNNNNARNRDIYTREKAAGKLMMTGNFSSVNQEYLELSPLDAKELVQEFNDLKNSLKGSNNSKNPTKKKN